MGLVIPTVGQEPGPAYANDVNASLSLIDTHDHSSGKGVPVTPAGLSITNDLSFLSNNATALRSSRFTAQGSPLALSTDVGCLYVSGVDLYFNDVSGHQIRITTGGSVNGAVGNVTNLISPAALTYVPATPAFVFTSNSNTSANLDGGSLTIRNNTFGATGITLAPPASVPASYSLTLPSALPASQKLATIDNSGNIAASIWVDNATIQVTSSNIAVKAIPMNLVETNRSGPTALTTWSVGNSFANIFSTTFVKKYGSTAIHVRGQSGTMQTSYTGSGNASFFGVELQVLVGSTVYYLIQWIQQPNSGTLGVQPNTSFVIPFMFDFMLVGVAAGSQTIALQAQFVASPTNTGTASSLTSNVVIVEETP
jgi:hypothetical protein